MRQEAGEFEQRLSAGLTRLGQEVQEGPSRRQLVSARHRRTGRKVTGLCLGVLALSGVVLGLVVWNQPATPDASDLADADAIVPLGIHSDVSTRRRNLRRALERLGVDQAVIIEKRPSGRISFVTQAGPVGNRQLVRAFDRLFRNFTSAVVEVRDGQMQISLLTSTTVSTVDRRPLPGEDR